MNDPMHGGNIALIQRVQKRRKDRMRTPLLKDDVPLPVIDKSVSIRPLVIMILMVGTFAVAELVGGVWSGSLALLSDAFHMASDLISLVVGIVAIRLARRAETDANTYGMQRAEVLGGLINSVFLLSVVFFIVLEAIERILKPEAIQSPLIVLLVGIGGLIVNLIGLGMLFKYRSLRSSHSHSHDDAEAGHGHGHGHGSMNMHGVFLHVLGDAIGSVAVIVAATVRLLFPDQEWTIYVDPVLSVVLGVIIVKSSIPLFRASVSILMQSTPASVNVHDLSESLLAVDGVDFLGRLHLWSLAPNHYVGTVHIDVLRSRPYEEVIADVQRVFNRKGVERVTIQPHFVDTPLLSPEEEEGVGCRACTLRGNDCC